ncbi:MAG TPA: catalase [Ramlibacter sp.]|uniref:catalase n=1 Tax=Ramlibacter sp. TaxID=1917967 RepID=UPI002BE817EE|nr:catalase [Ramlibacter sp.]HVZ46248.1 catalase [Ramlibacter sp.]
MPTHPPPSTEWKEHVRPDEEERFARYARTFAEIQRRRSERHGTGRALHRKQLAAAHGTLEVLDSLPGFARHGLFEQARDYEVWVRLSNGGLDRAPDKVPDVRGFSMRVFGVRGPSALGAGPATSQDFTFINLETFSFPTSAEFVDFAVAGSRGRGEMVKHVFRRYGALGGAKVLGKLLRTMARPFSGFATEALFSAVPIACGPYAVRVRLVPGMSNGKPDPKARDDWAADFTARLRRAPLHWDMQLQYFVDERLTPIEDASVNWPTPYATVARLMLPPQDLASDEAVRLAQRVEAGVFDPWQALAQHRPLGDVQRARKVVYFASQQGRGAV